MDTEDKIKRLKFLAEKLKDMMENTIAGEQLWIDDYPDPTDGVECDGCCLAEDILSTIEDLEFITCNKK